ncbi:MAG: diguanylate cyclase [Candidatus Dormibacteria bacterium]
MTGDTSTSETVPAADAGESLRIGVLSPLLGGTFFGRVLAGVARVGEEAGTRVVAIQTLDLSMGGHTARVPRYELHAAWERVNGFVVVLNAVNRQYLDHLRREGKPVVMVSHEVAGFKCPMVQPDNRGGAFAATSHLIDHGHRRIAFVGNFFQTDVRERYEAYREALLSHGIEPEADLLIETADNLEDSGEAAGRQLLAAGLPSTAVLAATDFNAIGLMRAFRAAGLVLPRDQAVVGFDDAEAASSLRPALSSVHMGSEELGREAARLLLEMIWGRGVHDGPHRVATAFLPRESCGCSAATTLDAAGEPDASAGGSVRERMRFRLSHLLQVGEHPTPEEEIALDTAGMVLARVVDDPAGEDPGPAEIQRAAEALCLLAPRWTTVSAVAACLRASAREAAAGTVGGEAAAGVDARITDVVVELSRSMAQRDMGARTVLHRALRDGYALSMSLLSGHAEDPRSLRWLASTRARAACLGLWPTGEHRRSGIVEVVSSFPADGGPGGAVEERMRVEEFPPRSLLDDVAWGPGEVALVLPVRTSGLDAGVIAMVGPVEPADVTGWDLYFQDDALLSVSVERQMMLNSLRSQREALAHAYDRERDLVKEIQASEERYGLAAGATNDGLWDWEVGSSAIYYSDRWKALLGHQSSEIGTGPEEWFDRVHPDDLHRLRTAIAACIGGETERLENEHRLRAADGSYKWVLCQALGVRNSDHGRATRLVGSITDVTEARALHDSLRHGALHDGLTGLPNRTLFVDRLTQALTRTSRSPGTRIALLFLDLDGFKEVNDSLGHLAGDLLLTKLAGRIRERLRKSDTPARLGGDEFAVLLEDVRDEEAARRIAADLAERIAAPFDLDGDAVRVTAAIGLALSTTGLERPDDLLRAADAAMYRSKGRRRTHVRPPRPSVSRADHAVGDDRPVLR